MSGFGNPARGSAPWAVVPHVRYLAGAAIVLLLSAFVVSSASAGPSWTLDPTNSTLTYQSVKKNTIVETNKIRNITGTLGADGTAKVIFDLDSVDTGVDLRNVRMRFLFFETYKFPTAELTAKVDPADFANLAARRRIKTTLPFRLNLHGIVKELSANVVVTMVTDSMVSVASEAPVAVHVEDFGLLDNVEKLQQAANVTNIVPTASVSFDFVFLADGSRQPVPVQQAAAQAAIGPVGTDASRSSFGDDECLNRFAVLSRTGAIYFRTASASLDAASQPLIDAVVEVVNKCPGLKVEVSGHTDSDGSPVANQRLSERRARAVAEAIRAEGVPAVQVSAAGYGEDKPIAPNDTAQNKALNRRIEFSATRLSN